MVDLEELIRRTPGTAEGATFAAWLRDLERTGDGWEALFDALVPQCERVAREFADVMGVDEARCACMSLAYERSVGAWLDGVERGTMARSFATLVGDQLRDHLRAMRRTRKRRASLDREHALAQGHPEAACDGGAEPVSRAEAPDEATHLREFVDRLAAAPEIDERTRRVLRCLAGGHDQREIARLVGISEPTVSRSVARLRGALAEIIRVDRGAA